MWYLSTFMFFFLLKVVYLMLSFFFFILIIKIPYFLSLEFTRHFYDPVNAIFFLFFVRSFFMFFFKQTQIIKAPFVNTHRHQDQVPVYMYINHSILLHPIGHVHMKLVAAVQYSLCGLWIFCNYFLFYVNILCVNKALTCLCYVNILLA